MRSTPQGPSVSTSIWKSGRPSLGSRTCEADAVISPDFVRETGNLFDALAAQYNAEYDGWEAAATP
ncbi:hypothetical protein GCM10010412_021370 [Nonomuraea recticatena]|uniref:Uncharacterized protein n=2 Tax=Nonomuraea recticatena TaxID=46178 RepID=A0ABN3RI77_9ACTN